MINLANVQLPSKAHLDSLSIEPGKSLGVIGPADSGKTALLLAILGRRLPQVSFDRQTALGIAEIGFVPTNPSFLFSGMKSDLKGELELSCQFVGRIPGDLDETIHKFAIEAFLDRDPFSLSGGEMVRAAMAIVAAKKPKVWLLDQLYDSLYPDAAAEIRSVMDLELARGHAVIEAHSSSPPWVHRLDTVVFLDAGRETRIGKYETLARLLHNRDLLSECSRLALQIEDDVGIHIQRHHEIDALIGALAPYVSHADHTKAAPSHPTAVVSLKGLSFGYPNSSNFSLGPIDLTIGKNEIVAIAGPNGSGKTTLLRCIANLLCPIGGQLDILGETPGKRRWEWARRAFYCFQNPDDQLYLPTVRDEIEKTLQVLSRPRPPDIENRYERFGLTPYLAREPYQLARPIRRMVCLAAGFISSSPVILLDEPTAGLDVTQRIAIQYEIETMSRDGFIFLVVTHDFSFIAATATRVLELADGKIVADGAPLPWRLHQRPPLIQIASALKMDAYRYSDLVIDMSKGGLPESDA